MTEDTLLPFDLPAVQRKKVSADFEGGLISSDGGLVLLRGGGTPARSGRDAGGLHPGLARPGAGGSHAPSDAEGPDVRDRLRI